MSPALSVNLIKHLYGLYLDKYLLLLAQLALLNTMFRHISLLCFLNSFKKPAANVREAKFKLKQNGDWSHPKRVLIRRQNSSVVASS